MERRQFLRRIGCSSAVWAAAPAFSASRILGANNRVRVGLIGCGGRGRTVARLMRDAAEVEFAAVCDVYESNARAAKEWAGPGCKAFGDFRKLLEESSLDAVLIATPDHWHAIPTVLACEAGKDVYVEKPLGHNIQEGRAMVEAARRHRRVVQTGTQQRSAPHYAEIARIIQSGELGKVHFVRVWNFSNLYPHGIGRVADSAPPDGLDWGFYLGPAPWVPFNKNRFLGNYRWFWDYGGGYLTDFGTHRFDSVHQVMGEDAPRTISATGRRFELDDGGEVPDMALATFEYGRFVLSYEACNLNGHGLGGRTPGRAYYQARGPQDRPHGEAFYGTNGALFSDRIGFEIYPELKPGSVADIYNSRAVAAGEYRMRRQEVSAQDATAAHARNFIDCVRSRKDPAGDVAIGHRSSVVAHLGNIAYRTGHKLHWDSERETVPGDGDANRLLGRVARKPWDLITLKPT